MELSSTSGCLPCIKMLQGSVLGPILLAFGHILKVSLLTTHFLFNVTELSILKFVKHIKCF